MSTGGQYVAAAYGVVLFALMVYVVIVGLRSARLAREAELLARLVERERADASAGVAQEAPGASDDAGTPAAAARQAAPHR